MLWLKNNGIYLHTALLVTPVSGINSPESLKSDLVRENEGGGVILLGLHHPSKISSGQCFCNQEDNGDSLVASHSSQGISPLGKLLKREDGGRGKEAFLCFSLFAFGCILDTGNLHFLVFFFFVITVLLVFSISLQETTKQKGRDVWWYTSTKTATSFSSLEKLTGSI